MKIRLLLSIGLLIGMACPSYAERPAAAGDSVGTEKINGKTHIKYLVSPGETIYRISTKYGVSISKLMEINPELEDGLKVGQRISIPYRPEAIAEYREEHSGENQQKKATASSSANQASSDGEQKKTHVVQRGETLYSLSRKYNVSLNQLLEWNGMELKAGEKIVVGYENESKSQRTLEKGGAPEDADEPGDNEPVADKQEEISEPDQPSSLSKKQGTDNSASEPEDVQSDVASADKEERPSRKKSSGEPAGKDAETAKAKEQKDKEELDLGSDPDRQYNADPNKKQVMVIPFDPHLYFSDCDHEIADASDIKNTRVRQIFRKRLNALLDPEGYEAIHLLGGNFKDSISDLNKIYSSVTYNEQERLYSKHYLEWKKKQERTKEGQVRQTNDKKDKTNSLRGWLKKQKKKIAGNKSANGTNTSEATLAERNSKYFGVKVKDDNFFDYYNKKYSADYYIFVNQFEVKTDYEHCLDRAHHNYARDFVVHFSIFNKKGEQIAGNRFKVDYNSSTNHIWTIVSDNMEEAANRIMRSLPSPQYKEQEDEKEAIPASELKAEKSEETNKTTGF